MKYNFPLVMGQLNSGWKINMFWQTFFDSCTGLPVRKIQYDAVKIL